MKYNTHFIALQPKPLLENFRANYKTLINKLVSMKHGCGWEGAAPEPDAECGIQRGLV